MVYGKNDLSSAKKKANGCKISPSYIASLEYAAAAYQTQNKPPRVKNAKQVLILAKQVEKGPQIMNATKKHRTRKSRLKKIANHLRTSKLGT